MTWRVSSLPAVVLVLALTAGCASSSPVQPEGPESTRPAELDAMRGELADRRQATRDLMDANLIRPSNPSAAAEVGNTALDVLYDAGDLALDVLSLRLLGLW